MTTAETLARRGDRVARLRSIMLLIVIAIATTGGLAISPVSAVVCTAQRFRSRCGNRGSHRRSRLDTARRRP